MEKPRHRSSTKGEKKQRMRRSHTVMPINSKVGIELPESVAKFKPPERNAEEAPSRLEILAPEDKDGTKVLPSVVQTDIQKFQVKEFAKEHFRQHKDKRVFNRKMIDLDQLVSFSVEPITEPLLQHIDNQFTKLSVQLFKAILKYTGVVQTRSKNADSEFIVNTLYANPDLRDEVYFQLIKQTSHNPSEEYFLETMKLFLIVSTIFPSQLESEDWIKAHLAMLSKHPDQQIKDIATLSYIRFSGRCAVGKPLETNKINWINKIPDEVYKSHKTFGVTLEELIWEQRLKEPKLIIPYILYHMVQILLNKGCEQHVGIFRLGGSIKNVEKMAEDLDMNRDSVSTANINDIASLFKKFLRELPDPLVPISKLNDLEKAYDNPEQPFLHFLETLPKIHYYSLVYLIGFLQQLEKAKEVTLMTANNLAIVFGPNIVQPFGITEQSQVQKFSDMAIQFTQKLIEQLDTSRYYPMSRKYFAGPE